MRSLRDILLLIGMVLAVAVFIFPLAFDILTSVKSRADIVIGPPIRPFPPTMTNYAEVFFKAGYPFSRFLINSAIISTIATLIVIGISFPAAYSIARFKTGGQFFSSYLLTLKMLPPIMFCIPIYILMQNLSLVDTHLGLIIVYTAFNLPFSIFLLQSFIGDLPKALEEAAMMDGASRLSALRHIVIPLSVPGIIASAILTFIACWNEFLFALILTSTVSSTVTVDTSLFITAWGPLWGHIAAAVVISTLPVIVLVVLIQKYLVKGLTLGAVKG